MQVYNREKWIDSKGPSSGVFTKSSRDGCKCLVNQTKIKIINWGLVNSKRKLTGEALLRLPPGVSNQEDSQQGTLSPWLRLPSKRANSKQRMDNIDKEGAFQHPAEISWGS